MNNYSYDNVIKELNFIFHDLNNVIKTDVEDYSGIKTRKRNISFLDALLYKFTYSVPDTTKEQITSSLNFENETSLSRQGFEYREKSIPLTFYTKMYNKVHDLYKKLTIIDDKSPIILAVDGTFNNINSLNKKDNLETSLNMGYYDVTNDLPLEVNIEGSKNKNNELTLLKVYLKNNKFPDNSILVLDRAYCSYDFINFLLKTNYKFVIRFRNNCKNFDKIHEHKEVRILKYYDEFINIIPHEKYKKYIDKVERKKNGKHKVSNNGNNKKNKKNNTNDNVINNDKQVINNNTEKNKDVPVFKNAEIKIKYEYTLLTNLNKDNYDDEKIKDLYKKRWNIEIFFKLLKYNFKFEHLIEHNKDKNYEQYRKLYIVNLIIIYLSKIIEKTHLNNNIIKRDYTKHTKKKIIKYVYRPNRTNIIKGIYKIINNILSGNLKKETLISICSNYVTYCRVELGLHKERKSKTPFLKWYVKGHSNRSLLYKFIEAFITNNTNKLNKNHKVLYATCIITLK